MTVAQIITRVRQIVQQTTASNSVVSDATILGWINECTLVLCSSINTLPKESVGSIVAADTITFDKTLLRIDYASISDGTTHFPLKTIDFNNFVRRFPEFLNQTDNKPEYLVRMTDKVWMMFPNPDTTWTGKSVAIYGSVLPDDLTLTTEEPPLSVALHHAYPHYCAWLFFLALNQPEKAAAEYATFDGLRKLNIKTATSTRGSLLSLRVN
jgi:hypothetical protein